MPPPDLTLLDDAALRRFYDGGALARGRTYSTEDRVELLGVEPGAIQSVCRGSGRATYVSWVRWHERYGELELDDSCTCPLGGGCKHCVAAVLVARRKHHQAQVQAQAGPGDAGWRRAFTGLDPDEVDDTEVGLALQISVHRPRKSRFTDSTEVRPTIRPLRRGASGKWIKTGASWQDLGSSYRYASPDFAPAQLSAIRAIMASGNLSAYYGSSQAVPLAQFGPDLWFHLGRAVELGVELIGERDEDVVVLSSSPATVAVDLAADDTGAVTLTTTVLHDGEAVRLDHEDADLVGAPAHGLWIEAGATLHLVPFAAPLHPAVARLAGTGPLTIPAGDVDEFLDVQQPALAAFAPVGSADGSVAVEASTFDGLVLTVDRTALDVARLRWSVRYRRGRRTFDHPLAGPFTRRRDRTAEAAAIAALVPPVHLLPALVDVHGSIRDLTLSGLAVATVLPAVLAAFEASGVTVETVGDQPVLREATEAPLISLTVTDDERAGDGNDWFDLQVEVSVDDQTVDFPSLFAALHRGDEALILESGTWLRLDRPEFTRLRELIDEARSLVDPTGTATARVNRYQAGWWDELAGLGVVAAQSERWAERVARMSALSAPEPLEVPTGLDAVLRPYQQEGFEWLAFLHANGLGGILADDMGLGKTVQTLALAVHLHHRDPAARFLVVAPTSVVDNWAREAARFAPGLSVRTIGETEARRGTTLDAELDGATLVVTSYALFRLEFDEYARHDWELLLLDEAQFVKNHQSKTYQCARRLEAATKVAITGTPLENSLMDLWSLLSITAPGLFPDPKRFGDTYRKPIESGTAPELLATLRRRIAPLMRRRTKDEVLTELPPKTEQTVEVELSPRHARLYDAQLQRQRQKVLGLVGDVQKHRFEILKSLTLLRQLALDPGLVDEAHDGIGSAKLDRLLEDVTQVVAEGHRALVFSQFTRYLARVRSRLDAAGIDHAYLDGRTRKRAEAIARFKDGDAPVFVISLKAGGFGLNLTEADYCFVLDPWWNPATETQAVDRAHRIGQVNPVMVYRYVSTGTIEEKVMELKARKADLFADVMDADGGLAGPLGADDIRGLLDLS